MKRALPTKVYALLFLVLMVANIGVYRALLSPNVLSLSVFTAGKGDVVLIHTPQGKTLLIDTGSDASILRILGAELPFWQRKIDALFITRVASSAVGGVSDIFDRYRIPLFIRPFADGSRTQENILSEAVKEKGTETILASRGQRFTFDAVTVAVLWPPNNLAETSVDEGVLFLLVSFKNTSFLVQKGAPERVARWERVIDKDLPVPNVIISSSTPPTTFFSDGFSLFVK